MREVAQVVVIAPNWVGDAVMALPAVADVRRHFARAKVTVAARAPVASLFALAPAVDSVVPLKWRGMPVARGALRHDVGQLRSVRPDVAILLPNSFASAWLTKAAGIPERWGYAADLRRLLLTRPVRRPRGRMHQAAYYQHLVQDLGIEPGPLEPAIDVPAASVAAAEALLASRGWDRRRRLIVMAPGAAYGTAKRWLPDHFARLIAMADEQWQAQCVLIGSAGDAATAAWVAQSAARAGSGGVIDLTGATSVETLAGVMRLASACVSNDSGAMHVAGAAGVPLAALFGPTREYETAPLVRQGGRAEVLINPVWCRPCMLRECPIDHRCMAGLAPERVFEAVGRLMSGGAA